MNLIYDIKNNTGSAKKVLGKTNYYVGVSKICARCGRTLTGYPALSRKDNKPVNSNGNEISFITISDLQKSGNLEDKAIIDAKKSVIENKAIETQFEM